MNLHLPHLDLETRILLGEMVAPTIVLALMSSIVFVPPAFSVTATVMFLVALVIDKAFQ